ncbi:MAG: C45 family peptidase [Rhodospirillum sp.]|nr:C45 family peptidase [Rhodospirillum sp.]MCF8488505.1 C45 family peptidase [Rhodospirillum sp.]MCF8499250.1 C45 family peptidase [Rhodospirillum sp.]
MWSDGSDLGWVQAGGTPHAIGLALGRAGKAAVHRYLLPSPIWRTVNGSEYRNRMAHLMGETRIRFPHVWAEIEGLAAGLDLPVAQVAAWNARGDLLASSPDGCTTVLLPGSEPVLAHNEDGLPFFRGHCFIVEARPEGAPGFRSFCYPGSIPGHTFAMTDAGVVQTVNNLRLLGVEAEIPRMVLGRALLGCQDLDQALALLARNGRCGGFHFALARLGDPRLLSVEFGGGRVSHRVLTEPSLHANHALHFGEVAQIITDSSRDRQRRGDDLLAAGVRDPLRILRDEGDGGLPIRRDASNDPDCENTLATVVMRVASQEVEWSIHDRLTETPAHVGRFGRSERAAKVG